MDGFSTVFSYWRLLLDGFLITLKLSLIVIATSTVLGILVGNIISSKSRWLRGVMRVYVEIFRGSPLLMQLFMGYFGVAYLGINISLLTATIMVFTLYGGAYIAEIIRSGIQSVPKGQWEAAGCIGLNKVTIMSKVILPQAFKISLPPLIGFYLGMIKDTSIASIIGYSELLREGKTIMNTTGHPFETYIVVAMMYFIICYPLSIFVSRIERRYENDKS